jgi:protein SCO1/2
MRHLMTISFVLITGLLVAVVWFAIAQPVKVLARGDQFPVFSFTDQTGMALRDDELRGRAVFVSFQHSRCTDECAALNDNLLALRQQLQAQGRLGSEVLFLTISLDGGYDTPADLAQLAGRLGVDAASWRFVTGDPAEIKDLVGGQLGIYYQAADAQGSLPVERQTVLIDPAGMMRARYPGDGPTPEIALRDLELLAQEQASDGALKLVYEASHLFLCYPTY